MTDAILAAFLDACRAHGRAVNRAGDLEAYAESEFRHLRRAADSWSGLLVSPAERERQKAVRAIDETRERAREALRMLCSALDAGRPLPRDPRED